MNTRDLGLNKEQVIALTVTRIEGQRRQALMEQIARVPGVGAVARFRARECAGGPNIRADRCHKRPPAGR